MKRNENEKKRKQRKTEKQTKQKKPTTAMEIGREHSDQ